MTTTEPDERTREKDLQAQAASWFVCIHTREPSTEEVADWQRWLIADAAHREAFSRYEELWGTIKQTEAHLSDTVLNTSAPRMRKARRSWPYALAAGLVIAAVGSTFIALRSMSSASLPPSAVVKTRIAEDRTYTLADGSQIDVGASTRVVVDFNHETRNVIIDNGEAYFKVAHETRPFVVRAGLGTITAVGTEFNVHRVAGRVAVTVVEGAVNVEEAVTQVTSLPSTPGPADVIRLPASQIVRAGEGVIYDHKIKAVEAIDTHVAIAWRDGHLKYIREPLGYVVADVERYSDFQITIADPIVAELRYTGTVIPDEIDEWLELLPQTFPIEVQRIGKRTVLLKPRAATAAIP